MVPSRSTTLFFLLAVVTSAVYATKTCNVLDFGAVANDSRCDVGPAISKAYAECVSGSTTYDPADTVLYVPPGKYALKTPVKLVHARYFTVQIDGELSLVFNASLTGNMILFDDCESIVWKGLGAIYGNGELWRPDDNLNLYPNRPRLVRFEHCNNCDISGVTLYNSPLMHMVIVGNNNVAHHMKIVADHIGTTDGFDVSGNNNYVHDVSVENGDECVTVKAPTNGFLAENIQCFYSAGCNIGSFGNDATNVSVQNVHYRNVTQHGGDGGIVLKSYPSAKGHVWNATYEDFTFTDVAYPIEISSFWCGNVRCQTNTGLGSLTWSNITFRRITGTGDTSGRPIVDVQCISGHECKNITFEDVNLKKEDGKKATVRLSNVCGSGLSLDSC